MKLLKASEARKRAIPNYAKAVRETKAKILEDAERAANRGLYCSSTTFPFYLLKDALKDIPLYWSYCTHLESVTLTARWDNVSLSSSVETQRLLNIANAFYAPADVYLDKLSQQILSESANNKLKTILNCPKGLSKQLMETIDTFGYQSWEECPNDNSNLPGETYNPYVDLHVSWSN